MHVGRAIEGSIGSEQKVDALYLSSDTQICHRVDQLCEVYDRLILLTGDLQHMLSNQARQFTRKIDCITMNESKRIKRVSNHLINNCNFYRPSTAAMYSKVSQWMKINKMKCKEFKAHSSNTMNTLSYNLNSMLVKVQSTCLHMIMISDPVKTRRSLNSKNISKRLMKIILTETGSTHPPTLWQLNLTSTMMDLLNG